MTILTASKSSLTWQNMTMTKLSSSSSDADLTQHSRTRLHCLEMGPLTLMTLKDGMRLHTRCPRTERQNEAFVEMNQNMMHNSVCSTPPLPESKATFALMWKMFPSPAPPAPAQHLTPPPLKNGPTPMDIDHMRGKGNPAVMCFCCQQPGHYTHECPQAFDIRSMTMEEKLELLPEFLALADVSQVPLMENGDGEAEIMSDFVTCSK